MDKKLFYAMAATVVALLVAVFAQGMRWDNIESVTARYFYMRNERNEETLRLNKIQADSVCKKLKYGLAYIEEVDLTITSTQFYLDYANRCLK
jgi:hypothetical protein